MYDFGENIFMNNEKYLDEKILGQCIEFLNDVVFDNQIWTRFFCSFH